MNDTDKQLLTRLTLSQYARMLEEALSDYIPSCPFPESKVSEAMRYSLLGGGKRIRGSLVLALYRLYHEDVKPALPFACALEMIHAYSLIHDDLPCMDDDSLRRGKPSNHIIFGEATALLAGDALLTLAFEISAGSALHSPIPAERILQAIQCLSYASGTQGMIGGQAADLEWEGKSVTRQQLDRMVIKKTGALIGSAALIGCILAGAEEEETKGALRYANYLGLAFQIMDDILDETGDEALLGKPVGSDKTKGKSTYVSLLGLKEAYRQADILSRKAIDALDNLPGDTLFLEGLTALLANRQM